MNPYIILFKFMLLMALGQTQSVNKQSSLDDFVIKKQSRAIINPLFNTSTYSGLPKNQVSIMHKMTKDEKLAIFCKMEHEVMKASGFAIKFRLGDQSFVDQLEGK